MKSKEYSERWRKELKAALASGLQTIEQLSDKTGWTRSLLGGRLHKLSRENGCSHKRVGWGNTLWGPYTEGYQHQHTKRINPRYQPEWKPLTNYDIDAHRKLAMVTR